MSDEIRRNGLTSRKRCWFFLKEKTVYEMIWWLEFRRVLFRSIRPVSAQRRDQGRVRSLEEKPEIIFARIVGYHTSDPFEEEFTHACPLDRRGCILLCVCAS